MNEKWKEITQYFEELLFEGPSILDGDEYVNLLFEDSSFSRSRRYFWMLGCITNSKML